MTKELHIGNRELRRRAYQEGPADSVIALIFSRVTRMPSRLVRPRANPAIIEGSYGFGRDRVTTGWLKASLRALDEQSSRPFDPVPAFRHRQLLAPGQVVPADIALGPSATLFKAGQTLRLVIAGRWLWPRNPLTGQFPAAYQKGPKGRCTLHWGPQHQARLLVPVIP
jgi:uncharacterized protein